jgi:hypothetical protein
MTPLMELRNDILRTLLYYDIWSYPLNARELYAFLPFNSMTLEQFTEHLAREVDGSTIVEHDGFYFVGGKTAAVVAERHLRERHARRLWLGARLAMHVIKRFPFVRAVFVSGDLSKHATHPSSDVDFFIITEPQRLWIARALLTGFKKIFLFNRKKFFCLNYFTTTRNLRADKENIFVATEIATLKPLFNSRLFFRYLITNRWIKEYFPNFDVRFVTLPPCSERPSILQKVFELPFTLFDASALDERIMDIMARVWRKRYPMFDEMTHQRLFKCKPDESTAHVGNFENKVLISYRERLRSFGLASQEE